MNLDPSVRARIQFAQPDEELRDRMVDAIMSTWDGGACGHRIHSQIRFLAC
jgi:hypothetical protein